MNTIEALEDKRKEREFYLIQLMDADDYEELEDEVIIGFENRSVND